MLRVDALLCWLMLYLQLCYSDGLQDPHGGCKITGQVFLSVREWWVTHTHTHTHSEAIWDLSADSFNAIYLLNLCLSSAKQTFNFEEYNFSQSTLEQVCGLKKCITVWKRCWTRYEPQIRAETVKFMENTQLWSLIVWFFRLRICCCV